jgi:two-component system sensor histidine kinase VanS
VGRTPGLSVRLKLTLSYAGFLMLAGALLLAAGWVFLLRYVPDDVFFNVGSLAPNRLMIRGDGLVALRVLRGAFGPAAASALAFLLVFGLVGGWLLAGRMLAPLTRITDATRLAANGSLSHRIRLPGHRDEFGELADAFDAMLARLEAHVAAQQRFAANASHELRTPLAITRTLLDVARNDPNRDHGELVDRLHAVNSRAIDLTEALLLLSRADQRSFTRACVDLSLVAEEATETLLPLAEKHGVAIETSGDTSPTIGSHPLLLQLTTNLVHNAIVHNLPEQGSVWVTTGVHSRRVVLTVENTGEKLTPELVSTLGEPFRRGTERLRSDHAGVGLGLAIVKSIVQAHDGSFTLTPRATGGLCVTVHLPAAHERMTVTEFAAGARGRVETSGSACHARPELADQLFGLQPLSRNVSRVLAIDAHLLVEASQLLRRQPGAHLIQERAHFRGAIQDVGAHHGHHVIR